MKKLRPRECAIVIVDLWEWHFCETYRERLRDVVKRLCSVVERARKHGTTIIFATGRAPQYFSSQQHKVAREVPQLSVPIDMTAPHDLVPALTDRCQCKESRCVDKGRRRLWSNLHPGIAMGDEDVFVANGRELYSYCRAKNIYYLFYAGTALNICMWRKSTSFRAMRDLGLETVIFRDLTLSYATRSHAKVLRVLEEKGYKSVRSATFLQMIGASKA